MKYQELPRTSKIVLAYFVITTICASIKSELIINQIEVSMKSFFRLINYIALPISLIVTISLIIVTNLLVWNLIKMHQIFIEFSEWLITIQTTFKVLVISELFKLGLAQIFLLDDLQKSLISEEFLKNTFYFKISRISDLIFYFIASIIVQFELKELVGKSINTRITISAYLFLVYALIYLYYQS